jgi:hypothetical protein
LCGSGDDPRQKVRLPSGELPRGAATSEGGDDGSRNLIEKRLKDVVIAPIDQNDSPSHRRSACAALPLLEPVPIG